MADVQIWKEVHERLVTPGGDPVWECPACSNRHCYGVEAIDGPYAECPRCHIKLIYPWEKKKED